MTTLNEINQFIEKNNAAQIPLDASTAKTQAASEVLQKTSQAVLNPSSNTERTTLLNQAITVTENPDGTVRVQTAAGVARTIPTENLADYTTRRDNKLAVFEENRNRADAIRQWGVDNPQIVKNSNTSLTTNNNALLNSDLDREFTTFASDVQRSTGRLPYDTPATDRQRVATEFDITDTARIQQLSRAGRTAESQAVQGPGNVSGTPLEPAEFKRLGEFSNAAGNPDQEREGQELAAGTTATNQSILTAIQAGRAGSSSSAAAADETTKPVNNEDPNYAAAAAAVGAANTSLPDVTVVAGDLGYNELENYDSYTYGLALHILNKNEYNAMVENAGKNFKPQHTLIASAGRDGGTSGTNRAPGWADNFFFDKLSMTSIIGMNRDSRGTNVINIEFTIIEPMGLSLIDRLIRTTRNLYQQGQVAGAASTTNEVTYFHNCYLLQIDFFDSHTGCIQKLRKFIPIKLTDLRIKVTSRGSEYAISAQPFGHQALLQSIASTPANFECVAGTLQDFFRSEDDESARAASAESVREQSAAFNQNISQAFLDAQRTGARVETREAATVKNVKSYVAAYNAWYKELKKTNTTDKTKAATKIRVVLDDVFLQNNASKLRREGIGVSVGDKAFVDDNVTQPANNGNIPTDKSKDRFVITAGTQVTQVINMAMANTEYIRSQIIIPEKASGAAFNAQTQTAREGTLKWWKIVPAIKLLDFDPVSNKWAFDITYYVIPFTVYNTSHPHAPKAAPVKKLCVREYEYLYTGKNTAVIDFQVDFDYLYFIKVLAFRDKATDSSVRAETVKSDEKAGSDSNDRQSSNNIASAVLQFVTDENTAAGQRLRGDEVGMAVASVAESVYSSARGEMLNVNMKIIGDPAFIKQDDMFTGVARALATAEANNSSSGLAGKDSTIDATKSLENNNNSLLMDEGDLLVWVNLRLPVDMDTQTGGVRKEQVGDISGFTGVYKVLTIENEFSRGQFTQNLQMVRYMDQPADEDYRKFNSERLTSSEGANRGVAAVDNQNNPPPNNNNGAAVLPAPGFSAANENDKRSVISTFTTATARDGIVIPSNRGLLNEDFQIDTNQLDLINTFREA
jgi:hypothetical protein